MKPRRQTCKLLSFEPIGGNLRTPQSWNRYAYVLGNPLKYIDPFGLRECEVPNCTATDDVWDVDGAGWGFNQFLWEGYLRRSGSVETGFRLYREGDFGGFRGSGYKLGQLIPMAQSGNEWAQIELGYDRGAIGALGHPAFDPLEIGVTAAVGLLNPLAKLGVTSTRSVSVVADKAYAKTLFREYAGNSGGVLMRDRSTGLIKGVQNADKTVRYRPKGTGSTNVELDLASGERIVIHIRHR